jgi:hypothetical protein
MIIASCAVSLATKSRDMLRVIAAEPAPKYKDQLMLLKFVGVKLMEWRMIDGKRSTDKGESTSPGSCRAGHPGPVDWKQKSLTTTHQFTGTMRFYDPSIDAWRITYGRVTAW